MSMKNSNDTNGGNRTRDLPACSAVPQPTASPDRDRIENSRHKNVNNCDTFSEVTGDNDHSETFHV